MRNKVILFVLLSFSIQPFGPTTAFGQDAPYQPEAVPPVPGTPPPTLPPTQPPTQPPTLPPTGVPTPTPCNGYKFSFTFADDLEEAEEEEGFGRDDQIIQGKDLSGTPITEPACIDNIIGSLWNWDDDNWDETSWAGARGLFGDFDDYEDYMEDAKDIIDDWIDDDVPSWTWNDISTATITCERGDDDCPASTFRLDELVYSVFKHLFRDNGNMMMDANCRPQVYDQNKICGDLQIRAVDTPLSLVWEDAGSVINETIVQFPLAPGSAKNWFTWRASGKLPLVVYDPQHKGEIRSASQLFGGWTFGGKNARRAALNGALQKPERWRDGYEALESLDQDDDGKIAGGELEPLALWFDYDRDGVSDAGEVRPIRGEGVTALYYGVDRKDSQTGDLYATRGFARSVGGREVVGQSVDWYSVPSETYMSGVLREQMAAMLGSEAANLKPAGVQDSQQQERAANVKDTPAAPFSGQWKWRLHPDDIAGIEQVAGKGPVGGYLIFALRQNGIVGMSLVELRLQQNSQRVRSVVKALRLEGFVKDSSDRRLRFHVKGPDGSVTNSSAVINADGRMEGESQGTIVRANGSAIEVKYRWVAERFIPKKKDAKS